MNLRKPKICLTLFVVTGAILAVTPAGADPLTVTSYSMNNGGTGTYIYQDTTYSNCVANDCTTTGAALSGGTGLLTDGVSPATDWNNDGNPTHWVGWDTPETNGSNPAITFNFGGPVTIDSVTVWLDNTQGLGGVTLPSSVSIDGNQFAITGNLYGPQSFTFDTSSLNLTGSSADVQFFQGQDQWIMVGEVSFDGSSVSATPEPASLFMLGFGLLGIALASRRRGTV